MRQNVSAFSGTCPALICRLKAAVGNQAVTEKSFHLLKQYNCLSSYFKDVNYTLLLRSNTIYFSWMKL